MSRVAVEPPSQSPKHGGSGNSRPFLSSSFLEPSSFHLGSYSSPISLSSPIFYQAASAAANAITGDFHGDKRQVHPNPDSSNSGAQAANRERNVLEQQRLKNEKLIIDYLSQIEISCNEDVQHDCRPFLSILRRTLKVDTVLVANGDISRILFDEKKTKHFHPLLATDRQHQSSATKLLEKNLRKLTGDRDNNKQGLIRSSSTSVQLGNLLNMGSFSSKLSFRGLVIRTNNNNSHNDSVTSSHPPSPKATSRSFPVVGGNNSNNMRRSVTNDEDALVNSLRSLFPQPNANSLALSSSIDGAPGGMGGGGGGGGAEDSYHGVMNIQQDPSSISGRSAGSHHSMHSMHSMHSQHSTGSNSSELAAMVFGQPFPTNNSTQDSKTARTTTTVNTSSDRTSKSKSWNRVAPWSQRDGESLHEEQDRERNELSQQQQQQQRGRENLLVQSFNEEDENFRAYNSKNNVTIDQQTLPSQSQSQQPQQQTAYRDYDQYYEKDKIRPVFISNDLHSDMRVSNLTKMNLQGVVRYFISTKLKVGVTQHHVQSTSQQSQSSNNRICTLLIVSTSPRQGLGSKEFELLDEIATAIEEYYEEQRKTMLSNAANNLSLVTSLVSTLQKDVEVIQGIQKQMAKDWRKVENVLIPFANSSTVPPLSEESQTRPAEQKQPNARTIEPQESKQVKEIINVEQGQLTEGTEGQATSQLVTKPQGQVQSSASSAINKLPAISEDRHMLVNTMMVPNYMNLSVANKTDTKSSNKFSLSNQTKSDDIDRFPSTAVEATDPMIDGIYAGVSFLHAPSSVSTDLETSIRNQTNTRLDNARSSSDWSGGGDGGGGTTMDDEESMNSRLWRKLDLTEQDLQEDGMMTEGKMSLSTKVALLDRESVIAKKKVNPNIAAITTVSNTETNTSSAANTVTEEKNTSALTTTATATRNEEGHQHEAQSTMKRHLQETLQDFAKDLTKFQEANRQLSIAIERTINVARGYLVPDRLHYANSCSHVSSKGMVSCFNEMLLTLEKRHYKSWSQTQQMSDNKQQAGGTGRGGTNNPNKKSSSSSKASLLKGNQNNKTSLLMWSYSVHNILANCPHRTFYDHIAVFLENVISLWSSFSWTTQISIDYEPEDVEMFDDWDQDDEEDDDEQDANDAFGCGGEGATLLTEEEQYSQGMGGGQSTRGGLAHIYSGKASRKSSKKLTPSSTISAAILKDLKKQTQAQNQNQGQGQGQGQAATSSGRKRQKLIGAMDGFIKITVQFPDKVAVQSAIMDGVTTASKEGGSRYSSATADSEDWMMTSREYPFRQIEPLLHLINSSLVRVNQSSAATAVKVKDSIWMETGSTSSADNRSNRSSSENGKEEAYQIRVPCLVFLSREAHQAYFNPHTTIVNKITSTAATSAGNSLRNNKKTTSGSSRKGGSGSNNSMRSNRSASSTASILLPSHNKPNNTKIEKHVKSLSRKDLIELGIRPSGQTSLMVSCQHFFQKACCCFSCSNLYHDHHGRRGGRGGGAGLKLKKSRQMSFFSLQSWDPPPTLSHSSSTGSVLNTEQPSQTLEEVERFVATTKQSNQQKKKEIKKLSPKSDRSGNSKQQPHQRVGRRKKGGGQGNIQEDDDEDAISVDSKQSGDSPRSSFRSRSRSGSESSCSNASGGKKGETGTPKKSFGEMLGIMPIVIPVENIGDKSPRDNKNKDQPSERSIPRGKKSPNSSRSGGGGSGSKRLKPLYNAVPTQLSTHQPVY